MPTPMALARFAIFAIVYALVSAWRGETPDRALAGGLLAGGIFVLLYGPAERWLTGSRHGRGAGR